MHYLKSASWAVACVFGLLASSLLAEDRPNIVLIMADDVSWECFGCYGGEDYRTPHIDRLATRGVRFSHCYSTPICTTSRVQLMTGKYNFRNYTHFGYLDPSERTFAHVLREAGYRTAIAGKWQLNGLTNQLPGYADNLRPVQAGFDEFLLWQLTRPKSVKAGGGERFWSPVLETTGKVTTAADNHGLYGPDLLCNFLCKFMEQSDDRPFFAYYPMVLVHDPFVPTPDTIGTGSRGHEQNKARKQDKKRNFVAMVEYMDKLVGRIVDHLEAIGKLDNTLILFTADNGTNTAITSRWQGRDIRGGKAGMKDMGTHVPLVAYWKGRTPEGRVDDSLIDFTDFFPTLAAAARLAPAQAGATDGLSFLPQLLGKSGPRRDWVFCHYQPYWNKEPGQFIRSREWKLYRDGRFFDIASGDLEEAHPLERPSVGTSQRQAFDTLRSTLEAAPPAPTEVGSKDTVERPTWPKWPKWPFLAK